MIIIRKLVHIIFVLTTLCLSFVVSATTHADNTPTNSNPANEFSFTPNMMGLNNWSNFSGTNNWQPYNNTNMMQMMGGLNNPYNATMPLAPSNNWVVAGYNNSASMNGYNNMMPMMGVNGAMSYTSNNNIMPMNGYNNMMPMSGYNNMMPMNGYNNMMPMMGVNGAMPYTNYNGMTTNNLGVDQPNMNTPLVSPTSMPETTNAWGSLDANAAWGLGGNSGSWTEQQPSELSLQDPADVIAQLMSGEHAAVYQKIITDAYEKGFADAMAQSGSGGICMPNAEELPEFSLDSE